jgi:hypothetical protein
MSSVQGSPSATVRLRPLSPQGALWTIIARSLFDLATEECLQVQQVGGYEAHRCLLASKLERNNVTVCGDQRGLATPKFVVVAF